MHVCSFERVGLTRASATVHTAQKKPVKKEQYTFLGPYRRPNPKAIVKGSVSGSLPSQARNRSGKNSIGLEYTRGSCSMNLQNDVTSNWRSVLYQNYHTRHWVPRQYLSEYNIRREYHLPMQDEENLNHTKLNRRVDVKICRTTHYLEE